MANRSILISLFIIFIFSQDLKLKGQTGLCFTVAPGSPKSVGSTPLYVFPEDFNNDGIKDLAVTNSISNSLMVFLGVGTGSFTGPGNYFGFSDPHEIISRDFNNDGNFDLAISNFNSNTVRVLMGTGLGTFTNAINYPVNAGPQGITGNDFNGDGFFDLATANSNANNVSVIFGNGTGGFSAPVNFPAGNFPVGIISSDFNGDGKKDLALTKQSDNNVGILLGTGTGSFLPMVNYSTDTGPRGLSTQDLNGDGFKDIVTSNYNSNTVSVFLGTGTGSFGSATNYLSGSNPSAVSIADIDGDGFYDLASANSVVAILRGTGTGSFLAPIYFNAGTGPSDVKIADFNGDTRLDLAVPNIYTNNVYILINSLTPVVSISSPTSICQGFTLTLVASGATSYTWSNSSVTSSIIVSPTVTAVYSATGAIANGCKSSASKTITVIPTSISISGNNTICNGNTATLNVSGASSYTWSNSQNSASITVSPSITTSYSVLGNNSCGSYSSAVVLNVNPLPTVTVNSGTICSGNSFTIIPTGANTYTFEGGNAVVSPTTTTSYTVIGTSTAGCISPTVATSSINVNPNPTVSVNSGAICAGNSFTIAPTGANTYTIQGGNSVVSPTVSSNYTVSGTNAFGCISASAAVCNVTVNALPMITVNSGSICSGNSFTILPGGANTYTIQGGNFVVNPVSTTTYTITGTSTAGCISSTAAVSNITVLSLPAVSAISNLSVICAGANATLTANGATNYTWSPGGTGNSLIISPTITTTYTLTGNDATTGCYNYAVITQNVSSCTGILSSILGDLETSLIPNPNNGSFELMINSGITKATFILFNISGQKVHEQKIYEGSNKIKTNDLGFGLYYYNLIIDNYPAKTGKVIIE